MDEKKHNGWTNYATWRVNLEIFDGYEPDTKPIDYQFAEDMAKEIVIGAVPENSLVATYALAFMQDVNWYEIAKHLNED